MCSPRVLVCCVGLWVVATSAALAACVSDSDGDGVCDDLDICQLTVPGAPVDSSGCPAFIPGDFDNDGDVDAADFAKMASNLSGSGVAANAAARERGDFDGDVDMDLRDVAGFQRHYSGANQPADPSFARHHVRIEDGCLRITGTPAGTVLVLRLRPGLPGVLDIDADNDGVVDFSFDRALFGCIVIDAAGGDDVVWIDEAYGVFTNTETTSISGGSGHDTLLGGSGAETIRGGPGDDYVHLGAGNDVFVWRDGDGSDIVDGGDGSDTVQVHGGMAGEEFVTTANGTRVRVDELSAAPFDLDIGACEQLVINGHGGNDTMSCVGNLAALIAITLDGGAGDDTLLGSNGADVLIGGDGNDLVDGNQGNDVALLGAGDDTFQWDPGDGSDTVEGQAGTDVLAFNGSGANEIIELAANGGRLRLTRNVGSIVMDADDVERVEMRALGGTDVVAVGGLSGTSVNQVDVDLAGTLGGGSGDTLADSVSIVGTVGADAIEVLPDGPALVVVADVAVRVRGYEGGDQIAVDGVGGDLVTVNGTAGTDQLTVIRNGTQLRVDVIGVPVGVGLSGALSLTVKGLGGADQLSCAGDVAGLGIPVTLDGGAGDDTLLGSNGADVLIGGDGNDFVDGNQGNDLALLGAGEDTFQWDPGDGSDTVEGQAGTDVLAFNGSGANGIIELDVNGGRLRLTRNVGSIVMDADDVERVQVNALGGADTVTVNSLAGTDVSQVSVDLAGLGGAGDAQADNVIVNGTATADAFSIAAVSGAVEVSGLAALVRVTRPEAALDRLTVNGLGGVDTFVTGPGVSALILLTLNQ